jgi:methylmalonyl-CoA mutase N-terminal domain/subunit
VPQHPHNNVVRTTLQALAAVLGGTQSLHTNSFDETFALPTEEAATLALRTQQIVAEETGIPAVADPLGGSYYVEHLTDRMETEATHIIRTIDEMGGIVRAVEAGWPQREIAASAYRYQREVDSGARKVVGLNRHVQNDKDGADGAAAIPTLKIDDGPERGQVAEVQRLRAGRDAARASEGLAIVRRACADEGANVMDAVLEAARRDVTLGEICRVFREVFGEYRDPAEV